MQLSSLLGHTQEVLRTILTSPRPADSLIEQFFRARRYLGSHDRRFIAETAYGTLRHLRRSEVLLHAASDGMEAEFFDDDRALLLIAAFHLHERRQPALAPDAVGMCLKSSRLKPVLPELLRRLEGQSMPAASSDRERIGQTYSFPDWMVERLMAEYGAERAERICSSLNDPAPLTVRVNTLKSTVEACQEALRSQGVETVPTKHSPFGLLVPKRMNTFTLQAFKDGMFEVQDEGSQLLPFLIDPKPTAKVLDACAGAGGKTLEFSMLMKNRGEILATDVHSGRLEELRKRMRRSGAQNIRIREIDDLADLHRDFAGFFDVVFVDAPCSGLGTIRRNPGMKWNVTPQTVDEISEKQAAILEGCAPLVKQHGRLVYVTCTLFRQENESVATGFLERHAEFRAVDPRVSVERASMSDAAEGTWIKFLPDVYGTDGFFCAVLEKGGAGAHSPAVS
jgi:16S rRNA (cytosine967-C5)-methyltransferase